MTSCAQKRQNNISFMAEFQKFKTRYHTDDLKQVIISIFIHFIISQSNINEYTQQAMVRIDQKLVYFFFPRELKDSSIYTRT